MQCACRTAVTVLIAAAALFLQGCGPNNGSCDGFEFVGGNVAAVRRFHSGSPECADGGEYAGPKLTCNWAGVKCAKGEKEGDALTCGLTYVFGEKGDGLDEDKWKTDSKPDYVDKDDVPQPSFTAVAEGADLAAKAIKAAKMEPTEKMLKQAKDAIDKAKEAAEAAKKKAEGAAEAAKKKAEDLADAAKKHVKGDDGKDDAKAEEKRRLADDKKADAKDDAKKADSKDDAKKAAPAPAVAKKMKCAAPKKKAADKDDGKDKGDAKDEAKDDGKDKAEKLYSLNGPRATSADAGFGWAMPLAGVVAVAGIAFAALKAARASTARSRSLAAGERDEESSQEAIE